MIESTIVEGDEGLVIMMMCDFVFGRYEVDL